MEPKFIKKGMYRYNYVEDSGKMHVFAHPLHRLMAQIIDGFLVGFVGYILLAIFMPGISEDRDQIQVILGAVFLLYMILFQIFGNGGSIGKNYTGIHVVNKDFDKAKWYQIIWRAVRYPIHGLLWELPYLIMFFNKKSSAISDMVAHTHVVYHEHKIPKFVHELKDK